MKAKRFCSTKFSLESDIRFSGAVLLSNLVIQIILGFCGEIGQLDAIQCSSRTTRLVTRQIELCSLGTTILTRNFPVSI